MKTPIASEYLNDQDISTYTGVYRIGVGDVRIPLANSYALLKRIAVPAIQDNRPGWDAPVRYDNTLAPTPRFRFTLAGVLTDPQKVDFLVEGIRA